MRWSLKVQRTDRPVLHVAQQRHPGFVEAVVADARATSAARGDQRRPTSPVGVVMQVLHLVWATDAFGSLLLYRLRASWQRAGIPVVPRLAHRLSMSWAQVCIGDPVVIEPGVQLLHGQIVIDGFSEIGAGTLIRPFVTIGLVDGVIKGPRIGRDVKIGTGAKLLGPIVVGDGANIGANAVVITDVAAGAVVVGVPASPTH